MVRIWALLVCDFPIPSAFTTPSWDDPTEVPQRSPVTCDDAASQVGVGALMRGNFHRIQGEFHGEWMDLVWTCPT